MSDRILLSCPAAMERFTQFLDGELGELEGRAVEHHVDSCASCRDQAGTLAEVHRDLETRSARKEIAAADPIPALLARIRWDSAASRRVRRPHAVSSDAWKVVAAAAVVAACALGVLLMDRTAAPKRVAKAEPPPIAIPIAIPERAPEAPKVAAPTVNPIAPPPAIPDRTPVPEVPAPTPEPERPSAPTTVVAAPEFRAPIARVVNGRALAVGDTLTVDAAAVVLYPDGTRLFAAPETSLTFGGRGKTIAVTRGEVAADVAPQPRDEPMTFVTAGAEVRVVGTVLSIAARPGSTLVTVEKGKVQVVRKSDRWSIPLHEGQYATVEAGRLPTPRSLPGNLLADPGFEADGKGWEGVFNPQMGRNFGGVSVVPDPCRSGRRSLQFITDPAVGRDREVYQDFAASPAESVEVTGWIRTAGIGGRGVSLSLLWLGTSAAVSADLTATVRSKNLVLREDVAGVLTGTNDWARLSTRVVAPPKARQVRVLLYADADPAGPATAWLDDVNFRRYQKGK